MSRLLTMLLVTILGAMPALGQSTSDGELPFYTLPEVPKTLILDGEIDLRSPIAFKRALETHPDIQFLVLQSGNGSTTAAFMIAREVRERRLLTLVPEDSRCTGACAYLFLAGPQRLALGEVATRKLTGDEQIEEGLMNDWDLRERLGEYGVNSSVIDRIVQAPGDRLHIISKGDMASLNTVANDQAVVALLDTIPVLRPGARDERSEDIDRAKAFVMKVIDAITLSKADFVAQATDFYADQVINYSSISPKDELIKPQAEYIDTWPWRSFKIDTNTLTASCNRGYCEVRGSLYFKVMNTRVMKRRAGTITFNYAIELRPTPRVVAEYEHALTDWAAKW